MPITVEIVDEIVRPDIFERVFGYFMYIDETFSTYKDSSEISQINKGLIAESEYSEDMKTVFSLAERFKKQTDGFFDIQRVDGTRDPSGLVKGWAIENSAHMVYREGYRNFTVEAGGDIQVFGSKGTDGYWRAGIRSPFGLPDEIIKVLRARDVGIATSGTYQRGNHIYNPKKYTEPIEDSVSLTVIGPSLFIADVFATAAFAMGGAGIQFIESQSGYEGYLIDAHGIATMTSNFNLYVLES